MESGSEKASRVIGQEVLTYPGQLSSRGRWSPATWWLSGSWTGSPGTIGQLREALDSQIVIGQAKGVLAAKRHIPVDEAFQILRKHARSHSASLRSVAEAMVSLGLRLSPLYRGVHPASAGLVSDPSARRCMRACPGW